MAMTVKTTRIIGTTLVVYSVWEEYKAHSTLTYINDVKMGRVGTRALPDEIRTLPAGSEERYSAVKSWHARQYDVAYTEIARQVPGLKDGYRSMGEITIDSAA